MLAILAIPLLAVALVVAIPMALFMLRADTLWPNPEKQVKAPDP